MERGIIAVERLARWCLSRLVSCFLQAEDGIRDVERSRGLGDLYERQVEPPVGHSRMEPPVSET